MGPWSYAKHLISGSRLPFTAAYFGSIALTLYFAIGVSKYFLFWFICFRHSQTGCWFLKFCPFVLWRVTLHLVQRDDPSMLLPLHFLVCRTLLYPNTGSEVALHHREKGNTAAFTSMRGTT